MSDAFNIEPLDPLIPIKPVRRKNPDKDEKNKKHKDKKNDPPTNKEGDEEPSVLEDKKGNFHIDEFV